MELNVGAIPVCDGKNLVGMVTDGDLVLRVMAQRRDPSTTTVRDTMTPEPRLCETRGAAIWSPKK